MNRFILKFSAKRREQIADFLRYSSLSFMAYGILTAGGIETGATTFLRVLTIFCLSFALEMLANRFNMANRDTGKGSGRKIGKFKM